MCALHVSHNKCMIDIFVYTLQCCPYCMKSLNTNKRTRFSSSARKLHPWTCKLKTMEVTFDYTILYSWTNVTFVKLSFVANVHLCRLRKQCKKQIESRKKPCQEWNRNSLMKRSVSWRKENLYTCNYMYIRRTVTILLYM